MALKLQRNHTLRIAPCVVFRTLFGAPLPINSLAMQQNGPCTIYLLPPRESLQKKRPAGSGDPAGAYARNRSREEGRYTRDGIECRVGRYPHWAALMSGRIL